LERKIQGRKFGNRPEMEGESTHLEKCLEHHGNPSVPSHPALSFTVKFKWHQDLLSIHWNDPALLCFIKMPRPSIFLMAVLRRAAVVWSIQHSPGH